MRPPFGKIFSLRVFRAHLRLALECVTFVVLFVKLLPWVFCCFSLSEAEKVNVVSVFLHCIHALFPVRKAFPPNVVTQFSETFLGHLSKNTKSP